jgi:ribosomal protein S6
LRGKQPRASILPMDKDNKLYEIAYLITPAFTEEEALDFHQKIKNEAIKLGGIIDHEGDVKKRRLSYPINKMTEANLAYFRVILPKENADKLKNDLKRDEVLRSLFVETKRNPVRTFHSKPTTKTVSDEIVPASVETTIQSEPESQAKMEEIDKKLEEILGA